MSTIKNKYNAKAIESFVTRLNLFLFDQIVNKGIKHIDELEFEKELFFNFVIDEKIKIQYSAEYWQYNYNEKLNGIEINEIYNKLHSAKKNFVDKIEKLKELYINEKYEEIFPFDEFKRKLDEKDKRCHYCDITVDEINLLIDRKKLFNKHDTRGFELELDRNANEEYTKDNTVLCCYWCNNAKTDEFSQGEFEKIGKVIREIWNERKIDTRENN